MTMFHDALNFEERSINGMILETFFLQRNTKEDILEKKCFFLDTMNAQHLSKIILQVFLQQLLGLFC